MTTTLERPVTPADPAPRGPGARALTWTGAIIGGVLLLSGAYSAVDLLVLGSDDAKTLTGQESYAAAPVVELVADGHVTVTTGGERVSVERTARTALSTAHYSADESDGRLTVEHVCSGWRPGYCSASLDVTVPDGTSVLVRARDGSVTATGLTGPLDVRVSDGRSEIRDIAGDVNIRTADGDTQVGDVRGDVTVSSADGSVSIEDVSGSVETRSADGWVEIADVRGDVDSRAADGDVTVHGPGEPVALDISATDGRETVEGPVDPMSSLHVRIHTTDGDASYLRPRS
jgi:hypothetical protein